MDSFDKEIKRLYDDGSQENIPAGYSWEENAEGIYGKMTKREKDRRGLLLLLSLLLTAIFVWWYADSVDTSVTSTDDVSEVAVSEQIIKSNINTELQLGSTLGDIDKKYSSVVKVSPEISQSDAKPTANKVKKHKETYTAAAPHDEVPQAATMAKAGKYTDGDEPPSPASRLATDLEQPIALADLNSGKDKSFDATKVSTDYQGLLPLASLALSPVIRHNRRPIALAYHPLPDDRAPTVRKSVLSSSVAVHGGTLITVGQYRQGSLKSEYSAWKPGYHAGISYKLKDIKGRYASLRYDHEFAVQYFNFQDEDFVQVDQVGVVVRLVTSALTGRTTEVREDVTSQVGRQRDYRTYNTFRSHRFSLVAGTKIAKWGSLSLDAGIGLSTSLLRSTAGYNVNIAEEVFAYGHSGQVILYRAIAADVLGELQLQYEVSPLLGISLYSRTHQSVTDWMSRSDDSLRPVSVQVGLSLGFKI